MKLKGNISILVGREYTTIEVRDSNASTKFLSIELTPNQLCAALSRQAEVPCLFNIVGLDKIGKQHENKKFEFPLPNKFDSYDRRHSIALSEYAQSLLTDGWVADKRFNSQDSFFKKDKINYARCVIRRWV